jgi:hypothetical protein
MSRMTTCPTCGGMIAESAVCRRCRTTAPEQPVVAVGIIIMLVLAILDVLLIRYS